MLRPAFHALVLGAAVVASTLMGGCSSLLGVDFDDARAQDGDGGPRSGGAANGSGVETDGARWTATAAGYAHACVLGGAGDVRCWGKSDDYQVGQYLNVDDTAVAVPDIEGARALAAGASHTCVLLASGAVRCFGRSTPNSPREPTDVAALAKVTAITAGGLVGTEDLAHTCAIADGVVKCWGYDKHGQLGLGTPSAGTDVPVAVTGLAGATVTDVSAGGAHTCARTNAGAVKCWGSNRAGQLGDASLRDRATPGDVSALGSGVATVAAGGEHTCALTTLRTVKCWGKNNHGQLGNDSSVDSAVPVDVVGLAGVRAIRAGGAHTCALVDDGGLRCWGSNELGVVGNNGRSDALVPVPVEAYSVGRLGDVVSFAAGGRMSTATTRSGKVYAWGGASTVAAIGFPVIGTDP